MGTYVVIAAISTDSISWTEKPIAAFIHKKGYIFFAAVKDETFQVLGAKKSSYGQYLSRHEKEKSRKLTISHKELPIH
jgi:hypothetical protein